MGTPGYSRGTARVLACAAAAARPRAERAVLPCAGAYVSGAAGSNECPAGAVRIEAEEACRTAAGAAGKRLGYAGSFMNDFMDATPFVGSVPAYPRGCYYDTVNSAFFNAHAVGAGSSRHQLLCATITTGAPPTTLGHLVALGCLSISTSANGRNVSVWDHLICQCTPLSPVTSMYLPERLFAVLNGYSCVTHVVLHGTLAGSVSDGRMLTDMHCTVVCGTSGRGTLQHWKDAPKFVSTPPTTSGRKCSMSTAPTVWPNHTFVQVCACAAPTRVPTPVPTSWPSFQGGPTSSPSFQGGARKSHSMPPKAHPREP